MHVAGSDGPRGASPVGFGRVRVVADPGPEVVCGVLAAVEGETVKVVVGRPQVPVLLYPRESVSN